MKTSIKLVVQLIAIGVGYFIATHAIQYYKEYQAADNLATELESALDKDTSNRTQTEKINSAVRGKISRKLDSTKDGKITVKDLEYSAAVFSGQYGRAVYGSPNYCKSLGVDISAYSIAYKNMHAQLYERANLILKNKGTSVEKVYDSVSAKLSKYIKKEVSDLRLTLIQQTGNSEITLAESCKIFNLVAVNEESMESVMFSNVMPEAYSVLTTQ